jgi:hypothetical protein
VAEAVGGFDETAGVGEPWGMLVGVGSAMLVWDWGVRVQFVSLAMTNELHVETMPGWRKWRAMTQ